jgi:hypothetical protein
MGVQHLVSVPLVFVGCLQPENRVPPNLPNYFSMEPSAEGILDIHTSQNKSAESIEYSNRIVFCSKA